MMWLLPVLPVTLTVAALSLDRFAGRGHVPCVHASGHSASGRSRRADRRFDGPVGAS